MLITCALECVHWLTVRFQVSPTHSTRKGIEWRALLLNIRSGYSSDSRLLDPLRCASADSSISSGHCQHSRPEAAKLYRRKVLVAELRNSVFEVVNVHFAATVSLSLASAKKQEVVLQRQNNLHHRQQGLIFSAATTISQLQKNKLEALPAHVIFVNCKSSRKDRQSCCCKVEAVLSRAKLKLSCRCEVEGIIFVANLRQFCRCKVMAVLS